MSQIDFSKTNTLGSINTDSSISSGSSVGSDIASLNSEESDFMLSSSAVSLTEQMSQMEQRLQTLLAKAGAKGGAGFTDTLYEKIKSEIPRPSCFKAGHIAHPKILAAAKKCDEAIKKFASLSMKDLMHDPLSDEHFNIVEKYVNAQNELYGVLKTFAKKTQNTPFMDSLMQATQFRASEALNIVGSMQLLAKNCQSMEQEAVAAQFALVDTEKSVFQGMQIISPTMHGHVLFDELKGNVAGLFAKIDDLEMHKQDVPLDTFKTEARALKDELNILKAKVDELDKYDEIQCEEAETKQNAQEKAGKNVGKSYYHWLTFDKDLHNVLKAYVNRMDERLNAMALVSPEEKLSKSINDFFPQLPEDLKNILADPYPRVAQAMTFAERMFTQFNTGIGQLRESVANGTCSRRILQQVLSRALGLLLQPAMKFALNDILDFGKKQQKHDDSAALKALMEHCTTLLYASKEILTAQQNELAAMFDKISRSVVTLKQEYLLEALEHNVDLNTLVEARLRNIPYEQLQTVAGEDILIKSKVLGQGAANTVNLCTYRGADGENMQLVFKPEVNARIGLSHLVASNLGYKDNARVMQINVAACYSAESIGCGGVIAHSSVGSFNGRFGLFMDAAPGATFKSILTDPSALCGINAKGERVSYEEACSILEKKHLYTAMQANLMRELCKLEWADILSGQADRHGDNYLVSIDTDTGAVQVTGIDNDASYGTRKIGMNKIYVGDMGDSLIRSLGGKRTVSVTEGVLDTSTLNDGQLGVLRRAFGFNQLFAPARIDRDTFEKLMNIDVEAYREKLASCLDDDAVEAAVLRLHDAQRHARELNFRGKVINDWNDAAIYQEMKQERGNVKRLSLGEYLRSGFYVRDFMQL